MAIQVFQSQPGEGDSLDSNNDSEEHIGKVLIPILQQHTSQNTSLNASFTAFLPAFETEQR
jgi:hypothetical protein